MGFCLELLRQGHTWLVKTMEHLQRNRKESHSFTAMWHLITVFCGRHLIAVYCSRADRMNFVGKTLFLCRFKLLCTYVERPWRSIYHTLWYSVRCTTLSPSLRWQCVSLFISRGEGDNTGKGREIEQGSYPAPGVSGFASGRR